MLTLLPTELQRRVLPYVGELDLCDSSDHHMHRGSLVFVDARKQVVCVPRQLYVVSHWHTWYPCGTELQKLFRDVVPVHATVRDTDNYELSRVVLRPSRRHVHAWSRLRTLYGETQQPSGDLEVYPSGFVPAMGHVIRSRPWGALEPFRFIIETNDADVPEV